MQEKKAGTREPFYKRDFCRAYSHSCKKAAGWHKVCWPSLSNGCSTLVLVARAANSVARSVWHAAATWVQGGYVGKKLNTEKKKKRKAKESCKEALKVNRQKVEVSHGCCHASIPLRRAPMPGKHTDIVEEGRYFKGGLTACQSCIIIQTLVAPATHLEARAGTSQLTGKSLSVCGNVPCIRPVAPWHLSHTRQSLGSTLLFPARERIEHGVQRITMLT